MHFIGSWGTKANMCGICGWFLPEGQRRGRSQLSAMAEAIAHRGPDDKGVFLDEGRGIALGHNRLSIIDLSKAGHQPMVSEDGKTVLVYNGEIYNFRELRTELESLGHSFFSRTDTEVVLRSFKQWGSSCVERFCGMFAFAIWSAEDERLFLARDPMGMKPLYYTTLAGDKGVVFASEIKAFLTLSDFKATMNRSSLDQFLEFGYTFDEDKTSLEGVFKLPPGHTLEVVKGKAGTPRSYFSPPTLGRDDDRLLDEREIELYDTMSEVVAQHLVADVPVGLLLSGGLDSSVTAALAARNARITTISMGFAESKVDERSYARIVADYIGSAHIEVTINPAEVKEDLENVVWYFDDLFADWGTVSTRLLYKKCRELGIKVVLVGEGSDEIFGGYPVFEASMDGRGPVVWRLFQLYRRYAGRRYGNQFPRFYSAMKNYLHASDGDLFNAIRFFESKNQLPNNYVMKVDKASMSVSVEARAPFLDRRITEIAYRTPRGYLLSNGTNKFLLRSMAKRYRLLPEEITSRPKYGASIAASWMDESDEFRHYARGVILEKDGWVDELGLRGAMADYFDNGRKGYAFPRAISIFGNLAWRLLLLNLWSRKYLNT
jgi:asparagine synthase (glutamine-hydrolysing)